MSQNECHCGKDGHPLGSMNCPVHGYETVERGALGYAQRLATALWEKHWKADAPNWKPLPELLGVLTQIDNMTVDLERRDIRELTP